MAVFCSNMYDCICRKCHQKYKTPLVADTDGDGLCPKHALEAKKIAKQVDAEIVRKRQGKGDMQALEKKMGIGGINPNFIWRSGNI